MRNRINLNSSPPVKIEDLIHVMNHEKVADTTLPDVHFLERLGEALENKSKEDQELSLDAFLKIVATATPGDVVDQDTLEAWASEKVFFPIVVKNYGEGVVDVVLADFGLAAEIGELRFGDAPPNNLMLSPEELLPVPPSSESSLGHTGPG